MRRRLKRDMCQLHQSHKSNIRLIQQNGLQASWHAHERAIEANGRGDMRTDGIELNTAVLQGRTLDAGRENGSKENIFIRRSCR